MGRRDGIDFAEPAADIAVEAEQAIALTEISDLDERIASLYTEADPGGIVRSAPGVGPVLAGIIAGRLGDPHRFTSLAAVRFYSGLVPAVSQSGTPKRTGGLTKADDPLLREAVWMAAEQARKLDPQLVAKYARLMAADHRHHDSAVCHLATILLTRIATCWRTGQPYQICDVDGTPLTQAEGKRIVTDKYQVPSTTSKKRYYRATNRKADRGSQESLSALAGTPRKVRHRLGGPELWERTNTAPHETARTTRGWLAPSSVATPSTLPRVLPACRSRTGNTWFNAWVGEQNVQGSSRER